MISTCTYSFTSNLQRTETEEWTLKPYMVVVMIKFVLHVPQALNNDPCTMCGRWQADKDMLSLNDWIWIKVWMIGTMYSNKISSRYFCPVIIPSNTWRISSTLLHCNSYRNCLLRNGHALASIQVQTVLVEVDEREFGRLGNRSRLFAPHYSAPFLRIDSSSINPNTISYRVRYLAVSGILTYGQSGRSPLLV